MLLHRSAYSPVYNAFWMVILCDFCILVCGWILEFDYQVRGLGDVFVRASVGGRGRQGYIQDTARGSWRLNLIWGVVCINHSVWMHRHTCASHQYNTL